MKLRTLIVLLLTLLPFISYNRPYPALHYTASDGLPGNKVYGIYRDRKGFLWFATDRGIARYNGISFKRYTTADGLADNEVFFFQEDSKDRLWMGTFSGKLCYYENGRFYNSQNAALPRLPFKTSVIARITPEKDSSLTIAYMDMRNFINVSGNQFNIYTIPQAINEFSNVWDIAKTSDSIYTFSTERFEYTINVRNNTFSKRMLPAPVRYSFNYNQKHVYNEQYIFSNSGDTLFRFNSKFENAGTTQKIYYDGRNYFLATGNGLFMNNELILPDIRATSVTQDIDSNYWISTLDDGVYRLNKDFYDQTAVYRHAYTGDVNYAFCYHKAVYFTTTTGNLYSLQNNQVKLLFTLSQNSKNEILTEYKLSIGDTAGNFYITGAKAIYSFNLNNYSHKKYPLPGLEFRSCKDLTQGINGLYISDLYKIKKVPYSSLATNTAVLKEVFNTIQGQRIFASAMDAKGVLWFSMIDEIFKLTDVAPIRQGQFGHLGFKWFRIYGDKLLGCTHNNQLLLCSNIESNLHIDTLHTPNSIWINAYKLNDNYLLVASDKSSYLLPLTSADANHTPLRPIENPLIPKTIEYFAAGNGIAYFFKDNTVSVLGLKDIFSAPPVPILYFKTLQTKDSIYNAGNDTSFTIPYKEAKNVRILFEVLSFSSADIEYEYSIANEEEDKWYATESNELHFPSLTYGTHTIKVRARTQSGKFSKPTLLALHVTKPYWATTWFILLVLSGAILLVAAIINIALKRFSRKKEQEHVNQLRLLKSEFQALNALMNPHFIFNTLNSFQRLINDNNKAVANEYLGIFSDLIRQNMKNISAELISLQNEINLVINYLELEKLRYKERLNYTIDIADSIDPEDIMIPPLLIQPLAENAIKHGLFHKNVNDGHISIRVYEKAATLYIEVEDNGIGIDISRINHSDGFGLNSIKQRIEQLMGIYGKTISLDMRELKQESNVNGTIITICIQLPDES